MYFSMCLRKDIAQNKDCSVIKIVKVDVDDFSECIIKTIQGKIDDI